VLLAFAVTGCAQQQVRVDGSWGEGVSRQQSFSRVLVVGVTHNVNARCDFEHFLVTQIRAVGAEAATSCSLMEISEPLTVEGVEAAVVEFDADAVLATVLVQSQEGVMEGGKNDTRGGLDFKATGTGYSSYYYGGFGRYGVPVVYGQFKEAPVITTISGEATVRSMLYATDDASLVYEVLTTANDLSGRDSALSIVTPSIAEWLQREGLLSAVK